MLIICYSKIGSLLMCIDINCAYVLIRHHSFSSEKNSFLVRTGGCVSRAANDGNRVFSLSLVFASNFSLLWLYFPDCIFPHGNHLDMARSLLLSYLWGNPTGNKMHIPFQKNSHRLLPLHLIGQGWNSRLSLMITLAISLVMLWSYRQNVECRCILPKGNLGFYFYFSSP